jgi:hypothetical protein
MSTRNDDHAQHSSEPMLSPRVTRSGKAIATAAKQLDIFEGNLRIFAQTDANERPRLFCRVLK